MSNIMPDAGKRVTSPTPAQLAGRTFRMFREAHRVSLRELAAMVGTSPSHLSRVELGQRRANTALYLTLCDVLSTLPAPSRERAS